MNVSLKLKNLNSIIQGGRSESGLFFRPGRIAVSPQLKGVEWKVWFFQLLVSLASPWNSNEVPISRRSRVIRVYLEACEEFLKFFSEAIFESFELSSHAENLGADSAHTQERTLQFFLQSSERKKNASARKRGVFSGQICSKSLSRSDSESKGLTGEVQLTILHDLNQRIQKKNSDRSGNFFFTEISGEWDSLSNIRYRLHGAPVTRLPLGRKVASSIPEPSFFRKASNEFDIRLQVRVRRLHSEWKDRRWKKRVPRSVWNFFLDSLVQIMKKSQLKLSRQTFTPRFRARQRFSAELTQKNVLFPRTRIFSLQSDCGKKLVRWFLGVSWFQIQIFMQIAHS